MTSSWLFRGVLGASLFLSVGCFSKSLTLKNQSGSELIPYLVVTDPPPPHREAQTADTIEKGGVYTIDTSGFNPVFYAEGVTDQSKANGLFVGMDLDEAPFFLHYRVVHYKVEPGQEGNDPALQAVVFDEDIVEIEDIDQEIQVSRLAGFPNSPPPGGWTIKIRAK